MREKQVIRTVSAIVAMASIGAALLLSVGAARAGELRVKGGLPGDWFVPGGSFTVGNTRYVTSPADRFKVTVKLPSSMPYVGIGWGHQGNSGLRLSLDMGAQPGKVTLAHALTGPWGSRVAQADIDAELSELRVGIGKVRLVPQLTVGLGYSF
jgi:hypothetical protein